jgi:hypothetical protein
VNKTNYLVIFCLCSGFITLGCNAGDGANKVENENSEQTATKPIDAAIDKKAVKATELVATPALKAKLVEETPKVNKQLVSKDGTIVYQDLEGGFYSFIANDGSKYTPMNLASEHKKDGLNVSIEGSIVTGMMTTTQFGELLKIESIKTNP